MNRIKLIAASMFYTGVIAIALCTLLASPKVVLAEKPATPSAHHPPNQRVDIDNVDLNTNVTISWIDSRRNFHTLTKEEVNGDGTVIFTISKHQKRITVRLISDGMLHEYEQQLP